MLRCTVGAERRCGDAPGHRGNVDDASASALAHLRDDCLDAAHCSEVIRFHGGAEIVHGQVFDGAVALDAGVVHQHIDMPGGFVDVGDRSLDGVVRVNIHSRDRDR